MTDAVNAAVHGNQRARVQAALDLLRRQAGRQELRPARHPMLLGRQSG